MIAMLARAQVVKRMKLAKVLAFFFPKLIAYCYQQKCLQLLYVSLSKF